MDKKTEIPELLHEIKGRPLCEINPKILHELNRAPEIVLKLLYLQGLAVTKTGGVITQTLGAHPNEINLENLKAMNDVCLEEVSNV